MEITRIQIRAPKGNDPGKVLERHFKVIGDTVFLVDESGKALASDGEKFSRKLNEGDNPKQVASQLLRQHYNATRTGPRDRPISYPPLKY
jgi:hypothetical protein